MSGDRGSRLPGFVRGGGAKLIGDVGIDQTVWVRGDGFAGNATLTSTASFTNGGTLRLESQNGGWQSNLAVTGTLTNTGTIDANVGSGGTRQITGNLDNQGSIDVEIGGTGANSQYVQLNVTGLATLAGTLDVALINGFTPSLGQTFRVIGWSSRAGTFTTINGLEIGGGLRFEPSYGATGLTLTVVASP